MRINLVFGNDKNYQEADKGRGCVVEGWTFWNYTLGLPVPGR